MKFEQKYQLVNVAYRARMVRVRGVELGAGRGRVVWLAPDARSDHRRRILKTRVILLNFRRATFAISYTTHRAGTAALFIVLFEKLHGRHRDPPS